MLGNAIPHEYEDEVYERSQAGISYRAISKWLAQRYCIAASYMAVQSCVRRVTKQREEADEDNFAAAESAATPMERLERIEHSLAMVARKAWRRHDCLAAVRAQTQRARIAMKQLDYERLAVGRNERSTGGDAVEDPLWDDGPERAGSHAPRQAPAAPPEPEYPPYDSLEFEELEEEEQMKADERPDHFPVDPVREDPRAWYIKCGWSPAKADEFLAEEEARARAVWDAEQKAEADSKANKAIESGVRQTSSGRPAAVSPTPDRPLTPPCQPPDAPLVVRADTAAPSLGIAAESGAKKNESGDGR